MKLIMKFKDGMEMNQVFTEDEIQGDLIELMIKGKKNNGTIDLTDATTGQQVQKRYSDLYSLEIVFAD